MPIKPYQNKAATMPQSFESDQSRRYPLKKTNTEPSIMRKESLVKSGEVKRRALDVETSTIKLHPKVTSTESNSVEKLSPKPAQSSVGPLIRKFTESGDDASKKKTINRVASPPPTLFTRNAR